MNIAEESLQGVELGFGVQQSDASLFIYSRRQGDTEGG